MERPGDPTGTIFGTEFPPPPHFVLSSQESTWENTYQVKNLICPCVNYTRQDFTEFRRLPFAQNYATLSENLHWILIPQSAVTLIIQIMFLGKLHKNLFLPINIPNSGREQTNTLFHFCTKFWELLYQLIQSCYFLILHVNL